jgi:hypothetical protein
MIFTSIVLKEFVVKVKIKVTVFVGNKVKVKLNIIFRISMMIMDRCESRI